MKPSSSNNGATRSRKRPPKSRASTMADQTGQIPGTGASSPGSQAAGESTSPSAPPSGNNQTSTSTPAAPPTSSTAPPSSSSSSSSSSTLPPTTSSTSTSSSTLPPSSSSTSTSSSTPVTSSEAPPSTSTYVVIASPTDPSSTTTVVVTSSSISEAATSTTSSAAATSSSAAPNNASGSSGSGGLSQPAKVAIGVVVPIAAIALLALVGLWWWRRRRARRESEEERRKEVEDYSYNPNADPSIPAVGMGSETYEMRDDGTSGYRGWGSTTAGGSVGRKASTTMSGGKTAGTLSDSIGHARGGSAEARAMDGSPDGEILGAMGATANSNDNNKADVHRGPSNASNYSAEARSEGSDGGIYPNGNGAYYDQYNQNPYGTPGTQELGGQPVIRDNPARRNTRIENPSHYPQQSAGIAQNF